MRPVVCILGVMNARDDIIAYINTLKAGKGLAEKAIRHSKIKNQQRKWHHLPANMVLQPAALVVYAPKFNIQAIKHIAG